MSSRILNLHIYMYKKNIRDSGVSISWDNINLWDFSSSNINTITINSTKQKFKISFQSFFFVIFAYSWFFSSTLKVRGLTLDEHKEKNNISDSYKKKETSRFLSYFLRKEKKISDFISYADHSTFLFLFHRINKANIKKMSLSSVFDVFIVLNCPWIKSDFRSAFFDIFIIMTWSLNMCTLKTVRCFSTYN